MQEIICWACGAVAGHGSYHPINVSIRGKNLPVCVDCYDESQQAIENSPLLIAKQKEVRDARKQLNKLIDEQEEIHKQLEDRFMAYIEARRANERTV